MRTSARFSGTLGVLLVAGLMSGCGAGDPRLDVVPAADPTTPAFDPSQATLTERDFCDRLDPTVVAVALGVTGDLLTPRNEGADGQGDAGEADEAPRCVLAAGTSRFVVAVRPGATRAEVRDLLEAYAPRPLDQPDDPAGDEARRCTVADDPSFGDPAAVATCSGFRDPGRVEVTAVGLVGASAFTCRVRRDDGSPSALEGSALDACRDSLERLASPADPTPDP